MTQANEQFLIDRAPAPLKQLGARLADLLDADHWNNVEPLLLEIAALMVWRPIETCPKDGSRFLVTTTQGLVHEAYYLDNTHTPWPWKGIKPASQKVAINLFKPTHWKPLPSAAADQ